jgi:hypothetical protein
MNDEVYRQNVEWEDRVDADAACGHTRALMSSEREVDLCHE